MSEKQSLIDKLLDIESYLANYGKIDMSLTINWARDELTKKGACPTCHGTGAATTVAGVTIDGGGDCERCGGTGCTL